MLRGAFGEPNNRPFLFGYLRLLQLGKSGSIDFLVDTGADTTCVHPGDLTRIAGEPLNWLYAGDQSLVRGLGDTVTVYPLEVVLSFRDDLNLYMYSLTIDVPDPEQVPPIVPILGRDVLQHWRMVYNPTGNQLDFDVQHADNVRPIGP